MSRAVREAQTYCGLTPDGIIGELTWDAIMNEIVKMDIVTNIPVAVRGYALRSGEISLGVYMMQKYLSEIAQSNPCLRPDSHRRQLWHADGAGRGAVPVSVRPRHRRGHRHADLGCHRQ